MKVLVFLGREIAIRCIHFSKVESRKDYGVEELRECIAFGIVRHHFIKLRFITREEALIEAGFRCDGWLIAEEDVEEG